MSVCRYTAVGTYIRTYHIPVMKGLTEIISYLHCTVQNSESKQPVWANIFVFLFYSSYHLYQAADTHTVNDFIRCLTCDTEGLL